MPEMRTRNPCNKQTVGEVQKLRQARRTQRTYQTLTVTKSMNLLRCIWHLGWNRGWRYWRIDQLCRKVPGFALQWAASMEAEADSHEANGVTTYAPYLRAFDADVRRNYEAWRKAELSKPLP